VLIPDTIMRAIFAHGAFDTSAAELAAVGLAAYGVGLPAMALVRIVASTFYARHDTMTPARVTVTAIAVNIALKIVFVWGFHLGIAGIALGTAIGAWVNVGTLLYLARKRGLVQISDDFKRALFPIFLAALAAGAGAWLGAQAGALLVQHGRWHEVAMLACAIVLGGIAYLTIAFLFRNTLPLGRLTRAAKP
jgi:putative peptidoglycan lipid II flippase